VLSDGSLRVEISTTVDDEEEYDIQIQGSDRKYPAIVLRRKHRGKGATIKTVSRSDNSGRLNPVYDDYADNIQKYLDNRQKRLGKRDRSGDDAQSGIGEARERWVDKTIQSVVARQDNSQKGFD